MQMLDYYYGNKKALIWPVFFAFVLAFSVFLHTKLGMDAFWDTANYHVFLGWSVVEFEYGLFGAAAQYHSYLNPLIDGVNYLLFFTHPYFGAAFHSIFYFVFAYVIFKIINELIDENIKFSLLVVIGCIVGITGAMTISLFGSWTNENIVAVPVLIGFYALLKGVKQGNIWIFLFSGVFFGIAVGLKLTAAHYIVGAFFACVVAYFRVKAILLFLIGVGLGFLLVDGYFMYLRWNLMGNPIFPLANNIFNSPYYISGWKSFSSFEFPKIFYYLSLPIVWLSSGDFSEASTVRDGRLLLAYFGILLICSDFLIRKKIDRQKLALVIFFVFSYFSWFLVFRIYRYLIVLEALSGVLLVVGLGCIFRSGAKKIPLFLAAMALPFLWQVTYYPDWGRRPWSENFLTSNIKDYLSADSNSLVFFADQRVSYLAPELGQAGVNFANLYSQRWWDGERGKSAVDPDYSVDPREFKFNDFEKIYFMQYSRVDPREYSEYLKSAFPTEYYNCLEVATSIWNPYLCSFKKITDFPRLKRGVEYDHVAAEIIFNNGWSHAESTHRWTDGKKSTLFFRVEGDLKCHPVIRIKGFMLGTQSVEIFLNGVKVLESEIDGLFSESIFVPYSEINSEKFFLEFSLPAARPPGNGDPRNLALAFQSMKLDCN